MDHAPVQYSGHGTLLFVVELQSDPLQTETTQTVTMRTNQQHECEEISNVCVCACMCVWKQMAYHRLGGILFKCYFLHPGQLCAVDVSGTPVGVYVSAFILIRLHSRLLQKKKALHECFIS